MLPCTSYWLARLLALSLTTSGQAAGEKPVNHLDRIRAAAGAWTQELPAKAAGTTDVCGDPLPPHAWARIGTTRWRQYGSVVQLAYSRDGKTLATKSYEEGFCRWDAVTGKRLFHLSLQESSRQALAVSGDGKWLALRDQTGATVRLCDAATGKERNSFTTDGMAAVALTPDGKLAATLHYQRASGDYVALLWDAAMGTKLHQFPGCGLPFLFDADGKTMITGNSKRIRIWDTASGKEQRRIEGPASALALSADGRTLATRGPGSVRILDFASGEERRVLPTLDDTLDTRYDKLAVSADGRFVALVGNGFLFAWNTKTGAERFRRIGQFWATAVAFHPNAPVLTWGTMHDPVIHRWDLAAGKELETCPGQLSRVQSVVFTADGKRLISFGIDKSIRWWNLDRMDGARLPAAERVLDFGWVGRLALSNDGKSLAAAGPGNDVTLLDPATGKTVKKLVGTQQCFGLAFSPDGEFLAGGGGYYDKQGRNRGHISIWGLRTGDLLRTIEDPSGTVRSVAFAPNVRTLAAGSNGIGLWDVGKGELLQRFGKGGFIDALSFTPDGRIIAGASAGIWDVATGKQLAGLIPGKEAGLALSPDAKLIATADYDKMIRIWDLATGTELIQLPGHEGPVSGIACSRDGKMLASASQDTTIILWDVESALATARKKTRQAP